MTPGPASRPRRPLPLLAAAALIGLAACEEAPFAAGPPVLLWRAPLHPLATGPLLVAGRVVIAEPALLRAFDPRTGIAAWTAPIGGAAGPGTNPAGLTARGTVIYVLEPGALTFVDAASGAIVRRVPGFTGGAIAADAAWLWVVASPTVLRLDPETGAVAGTIDATEPFARWAIGRGLVCVAGETVTCHDAAGTRPPWSASPGGVIVDLDLGEGRVIVATVAGSVAAYDPRTGTPVWRRETGGGITGAAAAAGAIIVCRGTEGAGLCLGVRESDGAELWRLHTSGPPAAPLVRGGEALVVHAGGILRIDLRAGRVIARAERPAGAGPLLPLAFADGVLFARAGGDLLAIALP